MAPSADVSGAQSSLARALARARAGEDYALAKKVREQGESVANLLSGLLKLSRVHDADNRAFEVPVAELSRSIGQLVELLGTVHLAAVEDQVYVNDVRIRTESGGSRDLATDLAAHRVGGLTLHGALDPAGVRTLVSVLARPPAAATPRRAAQATLVGAGVRSVELTPRLRFISGDDEEALRRDPAKAFRRTSALVEETYDNVAAGRALNVLPLRRAIAELLDVGPGSPALWEAAGAASSHAEHAAYVALVTLHVGRAAGTRTGSLQDLGVAALLHDVGYAGLPADVAAGPEGLARHPAEAARVMLRQRGFHLAKLRRIRAVLDHHRHFGDRHGQASAPGHALRLAEDYATLLRLYRGRVSPADALGAISRAGGTVYHPVLAQVMVNALGRYPPGTLLELEDGRVVRSVSPVRSPDTFADPLVRAFLPSTGELGGERVALTALGVTVRRVLPG